MTRQAVLRWLRRSWPLVIGLAMLAGLGCWKLAQDPAPHPVPPRRAAPAAGAGN